MSSTPKKKKKIMLEEEEEEEEDWNQNQNQNQNQQVEKETEIKEMKEDAQEESDSDIIIKKKKKKLRKSVSLEEEEEKKKEEEAEDAEEHTNDKPTLKKKLSKKDFVVKPDKGEGKKKKRKLKKMESEKMKEEGEEKDQDKEEQEESKKKKKKKKKEKEKEKKKERKESDDEHSFNEDSFDEESFEAECFTDEEVEPVLKKRKRRETIFEETNEFVDGKFVEEFDGSMDEYLEEELMKNEKVETKITRARAKQRKKSKISQLINLEGENEKTKLKNVYFAFTRKEYTIEEYIYESLKIIVPPNKEELFLTKENHILEFPEKEELKQMEILWYGRLTKDKSKSIIHCFATLEKLNQGTGGNKTNENKNSSTSVNEESPKNEAEPTKDEEKNEETPDLKRYNIADLFDKEKNVIILDYLVETCNEQIRLIKEYITFMKKNILDLTSITENNSKIKELKIMQPEERRELFFYINIAVSLSHVQEPTPNFYALSTIPANIRGFNINPNFAHLLLKKQHEVKQTNANPWTKLKQLKKKKEEKYEKKKSNDFITQEPPKENLKEKEQTRKETIIKEKEKEKETIKEENPTNYHVHGKERELEVEHEHNSNNKQEGKDNAKEEEKEKKEEMETDQNKEKVEKEEKEKDETEEEESDIDSAKENDIFDAREKELEELERKRKEQEDLEKKKKALEEIEKKRKEKLDKKTNNVYGLLESAAQFFGEGPKYSHPNIQEFQKMNNNNLVYIKPPSDMDQKNLLINYYVHTANVAKKLDYNKRRIYAENFGLIKIINNSETGIPASFEINPEPYKLKEYEQMWKSQCRINNCVLWDLSDLVNEQDKQLNLGTNTLDEAESNYFLETNNESVSKMHKKEEEEENDGGKEQVKDLTEKEEEKEQTEKTKETEKEENEREELKENKENEPLKISTSFTKKIKKLASEDKRQMKLISFLSKDKLLPKKENTEKEDNNKKVISEDEEEDLESVQVKKRRKKILDDMNEEEGESDKEKGSKEKEKGNIIDDKEENTDTTDVKEEEREEKEKEDIEEMTRKRKLKKEKKRRLKKEMQEMFEMEAEESEDEEIEDPEERKKAQMLKKKKIQENDDDEEEDEDDEDDDEYDEEDEFIDNEEHGSNDELVKLKYNEDMEKLEEDIFRKKYTYHGKIFDENLTNREKLELAREKQLIKKNILLNIKGKVVKARLSDFESSSSSDDESELKEANSLYESYESSDMGSTPRKMKKRKHRHDDDYDEDEEEEEYQRLNTISDLKNEKQKKQLLKKMEEVVYDKEVKDNEGKKIVIKKKKKIRFQPELSDITVTEEEKLEEYEKIKKIKKGNSSSKIIEHSTTPLNIDTNLSNSQINKSSIKWNNNVSKDSDETPTNAETFKGFRRVDATTPD